jgi:hypothetical protein
MSKEYDKLVKGNPLYRQHIHRWRYLFNSFMGGQIYAQRGYLTRYSYESDVDYQSRITYTPLDNHCKGIVNIQNSFLFREEPDRDFGSLATDPSLEPFLWDCDLEGRSLNAFMKDVSTYSSVLGHVWVVMVKPQTNARTRAEELEQEIRPYLTLITPMSVLDWRWRRAPSGVYYLEYLKYIEENDMSGETVIREWTEQEITTTVLDDESQTVTSRTVEINELMRIPAVCVYNQRSTIRGIGMSDIEDIARQQQLIYNIYSEIDQSTKLNGHPSLCKTSDVEAAAGPGAIIQMPDNLDPGLKPYTLSVSNDTSAMWESINNITEAIDRMANTAAVRAKSTRVLSGVAMEVEFSMLNSRLSEKADNLELAEEQLWRLFAMYQAKAWDGQVHYPDSFSIHDKDKDYDNLVKARSAATDPVVLKAIDGQILERMGYDKELLPYTDLVPQPGRTYSDGEPIPETLPQLYIPATSAEVPQGQNCANCEHFKATDSYCIKFDAPVRPVYWCAKWSSDIE